MMNLIKKTIQNIISINTKRYLILKGSLSAFSLKITSAIISFLLNVIIVRYLGSELSGIYYIIISIITIASTICCFGMNAPIVKYTSIYYDNKKYGHFNKMYHFSLKTSLSISIILISLISLFKTQISELFGEPKLVKPLFMMSFIILFYSFSIISSNILRGQKRIFNSILVLNVLTPSITLVGITVFGQSSGMNGIIISHLLASAFTACYSYFSVRRKMVKDQGSEIFDKSEFLDSSMNLIWVDLSQIFIARFPTLIIGFFLLSEDVGIFNVASRIGMISNFMLVAVSSISAPIIAELHHKNKILDLEKLATRSATILAVIGSIYVLGVSVFSKDLMAIFGEEFTVGYKVLIYISIAQLLTMSTGPVGLYLTMTGNDNTWKKIVFFTAFINTILSIILIPFLGIIGGAIAFLASSPLQSFIGAWFVYKRLGIIVLPFLGFKNNLKLC